MEGTSGSYKFRISFSYDEIKSNIDSFFKECSHLAIYQHDADEDVNRVHIHGVCMGYPCKSVKTFRQKVSKTFDLSGNGDFAVGDIGPSPFQYCSKGRYDPVYFRGWDKEYIDSKKAEGFDKKKDKLKVVDGKIVIERDAKDEKEVKMKNDCDMIKEIASRCEKNDIDDIRGIAKEILKTWDKNNKRGHSRLMLEWIDAVRYYNPKIKDKWLDDVVYKYEERMKH